MKYVKNFMLSFLLIMTITSCENFIGGNINEDPNHPIKVPINVHLPAITISIVDSYGGLFSRFCNMLVQQVEGVARGCYAFNTYLGMEPKSFDPAWNNHYEKILNEIRLARETAQNDGLNHYAAILDITEAFALMIATDVWDEIPYSQAFDALTFPNPKFDSQEEIYAIIYERTESGILGLQNAPGDAIPSSDDLIYRGDSSLWIKAAHAIRSRAYLHHNNYTQALMEAEASFESNLENFAFQYPDESNASPWYRFNRDRTGDIEFHPTMRSIMVSLQDTSRLKEYDQLFNTNNSYLVADFKQELISYREMQFVIAECAFKLGEINKAHEAYLSGIKASFERIDANGYDQYITLASVDPGEENLTLDHILTQKYLALFLQPEVYNDYRRTHIPNLIPVTGSIIPVRWDYAQKEYDFNSNLVEGSVDIYTDKVAWNR